MEHADERAVMSLASIIIAHGQDAPEPDGCMQRDLAFGCLAKDNSLRSACIHTSEQWWFDPLVLTVRSEKGSH